VPLIVIALITTWFFQNNLKVAKASFWSQFTVLKDKHAWLMSWLYIGTFGSFIGYSAGFPLLIKTQFPTVDPLKYAFLGPLVGSLVRPVGGWLSDKIGGARVTFWNFIVMGFAVTGVLYFLAHKTEPNAFIGFFAIFMVLFINAGIGNGSTYRMLPMIFISKNKALAEKGEITQEDAINRANKESGAVVGLSAAAGAIGAFLVPKSYGTSIGFYVTCVAITWWFYHRKNAEAPC
jgi:NNP family nitrate/nitrite transporter-like MFS transporter